MTSNGAAEFYQRLLGGQLDTGQRQQVNSFILRRDAEGVTHFAREQLQLQFTTDELRAEGARIGKSAAALASEKAAAVRSIADGERMAPPPPPDASPDAPMVRASRMPTFGVPAAAMVAFRAALETLVVTMRNEGKSNEQLQQAIQELAYFFGADSPIQYQDGDDTWTTIQKVLANTFVDTGTAIAEGMKTAVDKIGEFFSSW